MKITKVAPPINGGAIWSGEAVATVSITFGWPIRAGRAVKTIRQAEGTGTRFAQWRPVFPILQVAS